MKKVLLFIVCSMCVFYAVAQEKPVSDTSYIENRSGQLFSINVRTFDNGRKLTEEMPIGDTVTAINRIVGETFQTFSQYAAISAAVATQNRVMRQVLGAANSTLNSLTGNNYLGLMDAQIGDEMFPRDTATNAALFTMRVNGGSPIDVGVIRTGGGTGSLRLRQGSTNFTLDVMSRNWIRIRRYNGTATQTEDASIIVNLFLTQEGAWVDNNGTAIPTYVMIPKR
jgi:hypothetical protein